MLKNLLIAFFAIALLSCDKDGCVKGEGVVVSEELFAPAFEAIRVKGSMNVFIEDGDEQIVEAVGHRNIIDRLMLDESGGTLSIDLQNDCYRDYDLAIYITTPFIERVELDGSGDIAIDDLIMDNDLSLNLDGSGDITFNELDGVSNLSVNVEGSGSIRGFETSPGLINLNIDIDGSGEYRGFDVQSENCDIDINGSGDCRVRVSDHLDVQISGSGDVFYKGSPTITSNIQGSGDIVNAN